MWIVVVFFFSLLMFVFYVVLFWGVIGVEVWLKW